MGIRCQHCGQATRWSGMVRGQPGRSEEHTSELQSQSNLVCRLLLEKKKKLHTRSERGVQSLLFPLVPSRLLRRFRTDKALPSHTSARSPPTSRCSSTTLREFTVIAS